MGKCKDCKWFGETNDSSGVLSVMVTCCQKNAPVANAMPVFPPVDPEDGCGEFEKKEEIIHDNAQEIIDLLVKYFNGDGEKVYRWIFYPHCNLGNLPPGLLSRVGESERVLEYIKQNMIKDKPPDLLTDG